MEHREPSTASDRPPIGLLLIATGKYIRFVEAWLQSAATYFIPNRKLIVFLYTNHRQDAPEMNFLPTFLKSQDRVSVFCYFQDHLPWPDITLYRYGTILRAESDLSKCSHLFYMDADMRFESSIGEEILSDGLVATVHPYFWDRPREDYTYERRSASSACIKDDEGDCYYVGAFHGGAKEAYLVAMRTMKENTESDASKGIVAIWHDESHWNRYLIDHPADIRLDPGFCYPEVRTLPFEKKISALYKENHEIRS